MNAKLKWVLLLSITSIAGVVRFYRLDAFPPGLHFDEAFHQVEAVGILKGITPIYFTENMGMDPMHIYLIALLFEVIGVSAIGGRLVSAIAGTLAVPALWWLTSELLADWEERRRIAVCAVSAFVLSTLQWHITFSRTGIQPSLVPLLLMLTMACLWRGLRTGQWGWFVGAGVFLGAGPYAYSALRVVPLLILIIVLWMFLFQKEMLRQRWQGVLVCVIVSVLVFAPLGYYFLTHWEQFTYRAGQVTFYTLGQGSDSPVQVLWKNVLKTLVTLNLKGDVETIRNLPGRPALDVFQSILFWIGLVVCLRRIRCLNCAVLLGWIGTMLLPTVLTEFAPHFGRALGAAPAVAIVVGLGTAAAWDLTKRWRETNRAFVSGLLAALLVVGLSISGFGHLYAYFVRWGSLPGLYQAYDVGLLATSREVRERVPTADVYLSPIQMGHPIVRFVTWDRPGAKSYDGRYCLVLPSPGDRPAEFVVVPYLDNRSLARLPQFYPQGQVVDAGALRDGVPFYRVYQVPAASKPLITPSHPLYIVWNGQLALIGYEANQTSYRSGEHLVLTLYWRSLERTDVAYTAFTHLIGPVNQETNSPVWAGTDHEPGQASYPTSAWRPDEVILDEFILPIPSNVPAGNYSIEVGFYQLQTMQRLPISQTDVQGGVDYAIIGEVDIRN